MAQNTMDGMTTDAIQMAGGICAQMLKGGKTSRRRFYDSGAEIARYGYAPNYNFEYQTLPSNTFFKSKVALTAEAMRVFGPYLYQVNPHRTSTARENATPQMVRIAEIVGQYLNYTPTKLDNYRRSRRAIDDALSWGRGVKWTEVDESTGLIGSTYDSVRNLLLDPDAKDVQQARWAARRHQKLRAEAKAMLPNGKWDVIPKGGSLANNEPLPWEQKPMSTTDTVTYWCIYTKHGLRGQNGADELLKTMQEKDPAWTIDRPLVYYCSDEGRIVAIEPWSVPFYRENEFPCTLLDFYDYPESAWPVSPLDPAIGFQRAINWIVTLMMGKYRYTSRTVGAILKQAGEGLSDADIDKVLVGSDIEMLQITCKGEVKSIKQFIDEFNWSHEYLTTGMNLLGLLEQRFQKACGLYEILYSGNSDTQSRSATDASVKDRNSQSRVRDMRDRVEKFESAVARKEALALRFLKDREHVGRVLGPEAGKDWGFLVKPGGDDVQAMAQEFTQHFVQQGMDPMMAQQNAMQMAQEMAKQAVDLDRWSLETDYGIEADSIKRRDIDQRIDALGELTNQTVPTMMQSPDQNERALAFDILATQQDAIGSPREIVQGFRDQANRLRQMAQMQQQQQMMMTQPPPMAEAQPLPG